MAELENEEDRGAPDGADSGPTEHEEERHALGSMFAREAAPVVDTGRRRGKPRLVTDEHHPQPQPQRQQQHEPEATPPPHSGDEPVPPAVAGALATSKPGVHPALATAMIRLRTLVVLNTGQPMGTLLRDIEKDIATATNYPL